MGSAQLGVDRVDVVETIRSFSLRRPPYGTGATFTIHTSDISLHLALMALREQSCADDNPARWCER